MDIILDFETKSSCPIERGVDSYATDKDADVLCVSLIELAPDKNVVHSWDAREAPTTGFMNRLMLAQKIWAHNARFDQGIWEILCVDKYGFPEKRADQWFCTSHLARLNGLPAALDKACRAAKLPYKKSKKGDALIRRMSIPNKDTGTFEWSEALLKEMVNYCEADVLATKALYLACKSMTDQAHNDWLVNEAINDRGIRIDMPLAQAAADYVETEKAEISAELTQITGGVITSPQQHQRFPKYVLEKAPQAEKYLRKYVEGVPKLSLDKEHLANLLDAVDAGEVTIPNTVYNALQCKAEAGGAATAKFKRMLSRADADDRVRGEFVEFGASTGRFTSRGIQVHNFKRDCFSTGDAEVLRQMMLAGERLNGAVIPTLGKMLRPALIPDKGNMFVVGDWSQIENRALPFLAESSGANEKLKLFRSIDKDPTLDDTYVVAAKSAGLTDRQIGKVIELSLGYLGGVGAFTAMAKVYGVNLPLHQVELIISRWRAANRWAVTFGAQLNLAAMNAIKNPRGVFSAGLVKYRFDSPLFEGSLICVLPCGTELVYANARIVQGKYGAEITALKANVQPKADDPEWPRYKLWAGVLMENICQAFCASLLRDLLTRVDGVILHCHDEVVCETTEANALTSLHQVTTEMERTPLWANGLPLKAEPVLMTRYGKA